MKTNKYLYHWLLSLITIAILSAGFIQSGDDPFMTTLKNLVSTYNNHVPFEKIYLHIDRPFYKPGEDIWFKVYLTNTNNLPSKKSDVVYVDLINPKGTVEKHLTLQAIQGICFGDFALDESSPGGLYKIKAYTNWMHNFGDDYFFEKEIQVQRVVYSRLLSKLDFKRENFVPGDTVRAELTLESLENVPLSFKTVDIDISLGDSKYKTFDAVTDNKGKVMLVFQLPTNLATNDGLVNVKIHHEGNVEAISRSIPIVLNKISIQFFPEGGYLVDNVPCRIAFKAINEFGKPADIEGFITDEAGNVVTGMISYHQGMGAFELTPIRGKHYEANISKPGIRNKFPLPESAPKGYAIKVEKFQNDNYMMHVYSPWEEKMHLLVQSGKSICYSKTLEVTKGMNQLEFSAAKFPVGVGMVTLFDKSGVPKCERLVFFNYHKQLKVSMQFDKKKYLPREKISLKIRTLDEDSIPIPANLSLSVVNDQLYTFANDKQHNIMSWLLVGSDIKGKIEKPDFYFNREEPKAEKALDYLLLTQGWRRYKWDDLLSENYKMTFEAQNTGCISGKVTDKFTNEPIKAEVTILELNNRMRVLKVKTGTDGKFKFLDADANSYIQLLAKSEDVDPGNISILVDELSGNSNLNTGIGNLRHFQIIPEVVKEKLQEPKNKLPRERNNANVGRNDAIKPAPVENGMVLTEDVKRLEEVVVVGYGTVRKSDLTGCVVVVEANDINRIGHLNNVSEALSGRVSGLQVINNTREAESPTQIRIRGTSSLSNNNNPLYVIDGVVYDPSLSGSAIPLDNIPVSDIKSIEVLKDASSTSIYGNGGANGVIIITTKTNWGNFKTIKKPFFPKYSGIIINPRKTSYAREFYYPVYNQEELPEVRKDFRSTIYWNPNISTNSAGEAKVEFYTSDEITAFRAIAEGIGINGNVGRDEGKFYVQLPFSMAVKFPAYLTFGDTVIMPLIVKNNTPNALKGQLEFRLPSGIHTITNLPKLIEIKANTTNTLSVPFVVSNIAGKDTLTISFKGGNFKDAFNQEIDIQPKGFPTRLSLSSKEKEKQGSFIISKPVNGSISAEFTAFPDVLTDLLSGIESIIREPYGCFEQTSSSTYPNIIALEYLREAGITNKDIEKKALDYIDRGYKRLIGFETTEKGFEWFGHVPAHDGLTAYGLMEFVDMKNVYSGVDDKMIERTRKWLLNKRDGKGGFNHVYHSYGFGRSSNEVTNAYIIYALSEAGVDEIQAEYTVAMKEAIKSADPYRLSLIANAAYNFKKTKDGDQLLALVNSRLKTQHWDELKIDPSITCSMGKSLAVESAALYTLALLKAPGINTIELNENINYLVSSRSYGMFGSTQGTILTLKALKEYARFMKHMADDGTIEILLNNQQAAHYSYKRGDRGKISLTGLEKFLKEGQNTIVIRFLQTEHPIPYTFDAQWTSLTPKTDNNCNVDLVSCLNTHVCKVGETVRLTAKLINKTNRGLPMTMAVIGIPSGLSLQPWQLKEILEKGKFDFYEVQKNYLVLYYSQMSPNEGRELNFDLKADIPGNYMAPASSGYLYYTNEFKKWIDGEVIKIDAN